MAISHPIFVLYKTSNMLSKISWTQFFIFLSIVLHLYWIFVAAKYYREEILRLVRRLTGNRTGDTGIEFPGSKENSRI